MPTRPKGCVRRRRACTITKDRGDELRPERAHCGACWPRWWPPLRRAALAATFIVNNLDPPGLGFNDPTPAIPVGGNTGTTLGQQRQSRSVRGRHLGQGARRPGPDRHRCHFAPLDCNGGLITLGHARAQTWSPASPATSSRGCCPTSSPAAACGSAGRPDLDPGVADHRGTFNGGLATAIPTSTGTTAWTPRRLAHRSHRGRGARAGARPGLLERRRSRHRPTQHRHARIPSRRTLRQCDGHGVARHDRAQRLASMRNVRYLVWTGTNAIRAAAKVLEQGSPPTIAVQPAPPNFDATWARPTSARCSRT